MLCTENMSLLPFEIIKNAWKKTGLTQVQFAEKYEVTQYNLSKYINNKVATPDELTELIKKKLSRPDQAVIRRAVYDLLHNVA
jgi:transcriptional regulator with XRE-family HTH domain